MLDKIQPFNINPSDQGKYYTHYKWPSFVSRNCGVFSGVIREFSYSEFDACCAMQWRIVLAPSIFGSWKFIAKLAFFRYLLFCFCVPDMMKPSYGEQNLQLAVVFVEIKKPCKIFQVLSHS